jgi:dTDP-4-amino-4,6-dideoxygalactose transaminase
MEAIQQIAREYNLKIIEDCAQACGATYHGEKVGNFDMVQTGAKKVPSSFTI